MAITSLANIKEVSRITTLSRTAIYSRIRHNPSRPTDYDPTFPKPVKIGANRVAFVLEEVQAWTAAQVAKRDSGKLKA